MKQLFMDGYVCGNIETRATGSGKEITTFSVNSPERRKNKDGEWESVAQFFDCQYWHKSDRDFRAEAIKDKAHLYIVGEPRYESWEKDGQKRSKVVVNVRDVFEIKPKEGGASPKKEAPLYDEDIPF